MTTEDFIDDSLLNDIEKRDISDLEAVKLRLSRVVFLAKEYEHIDIEFVLLYLLTARRDQLLQSFNLNSSSSDHFILNHASTLNSSFTELAKRFIKLKAELPEGLLTEIVELLSKFEYEPLRDSFPEIFDELLYRLLRNRGKKAQESTLTPDFSKFICEMIQIPDNATVYNPFAGLASFEVYLSPTVKYFGQELNERTWALGSLRILAHRRTLNAEYILDNSVDNWNPVNEKYDLIIANPPYYSGEKINIKSDLSGTIRAFDHFFIEKSISDLNQTGKIVAVIPNGFLFQIRTLELRKYLVEKDLLEKVIFFPGGLLMHTGIPFTVLVINNRKPNKGRVHFYDTSDLFGEKKERSFNYGAKYLAKLLKSEQYSEHSRIIANGEISENEYNLLATRYFIHDEVIGTPLSEFATEIQAPLKNETSERYIVRYKDLKEDKVNYILSTQELEHRVAEIPTRKIEEDCLLLSRRWIKLKPTYFNYSGTPIYITSDIVALKINQEIVNINYLINELYSDLVARFFESFRSGTSVANLRIKDILQIPIVLPLIKEQKERIRAINEALIKEKEKEIELIKQLKGIESAVSDQNAYLRHSLGSPIMNLKSSYKKLQTILIENIGKSNPEILTAKISNKHKLSLKDYLNEIERDLETISYAVKRRLNVDQEIEKKKQNPVEIINFLYSYVNEVQEIASSHFEIEFLLDEESFLGNANEIEKTFILANSDLLKDLFNNLMNNAKDHAFKNHDKNKIEISLIREKPVYGKRQVQVLFSNTGDPFPDKFTIDDFIRKGSKSGKSEGDGFGGYYIHRIIKKMNGDLEIIDETSLKDSLNSNLTTSFKINIPIIDSDEEI